MVLPRLVRRSHSGHAVGFMRTTLRANRESAGVGSREPKMGGPDRAASRFAVLARRRSGAEAPPEGNSDGASIGADEAGNFEAFR
jgi:hypothetical protein